MSATAAPAPQKYEEGNAYYGSAYRRPTIRQARARFAPSTTNRTSEVGIPCVAICVWSLVSCRRSAVYWRAQGGFILLDATSGNVLWHFQTGGEIHSGPMAFAVDGEEYVGITAGSALYAFGHPRCAKQGSTFP
jgi:alcohol dehydrogenase (cytochrome c)